MQVRSGGSESEKEWSRNGHWAEGKPVRPVRPGEVEVMFTFPFSRCITALLLLTYVSGHLFGELFLRSSVFVLVTVCFFFVANKRIILI